MMDDENHCQTAHDSQTFWVYLIEEISFCCVQTRLGSALYMWATCDYFVRTVLPRYLLEMICFTIYVNSNVPIQGLVLALLPCLLLNIVSVRFKCESRLSREKKKLKSFNLKGNVLCAIYTFVTKSDLDI